MRNVTQFANGVHAVANVEPLFPCIVCGKPDCATYELIVNVREAPAEGPLIDGQFDCVVLNLYVGICEEHLETVRLMTMEERERFVMVEELRRSQVRQ